LSELQPIQLSLLTKPDQASFFRALVSHYHYLDCLLFGAPAWKVASRDCYIGWNEAERRAGLTRIANNMRFLILRVASFKNLTLPAKWWLRSLLPRQTQPRNNPEHRLPLRV
jgi:hypothetical protein